MYLCFVWILEQNCDDFHIQHLLIGFYNRGGSCLLRGTKRYFQYNRTLFLKVIS